MDRRIRDKLQIAGASDEYIMSRMVEVSIHKPSDGDRRKGNRRRRFFARPHEYISESMAYLRAVARCLEMEEPSLLSVEHSIDMVILHWVTHDDMRVWRAPAEYAAIGLMTTFFPEVRRIELVHLYDEDTAGKPSHRAPLEVSPLSAAMRDSFAAEWQETWALRVAPRSRQHLTGSAPQAWRDSSPDRLGVGTAHTQARVDSAT